MSITQKKDSLAAFRLEIGKGLGITYPAMSYGGNTVQALSAGHAIPHIGGSFKSVQDVIEDDSIQNVAFKDTPVMGGLSGAIDELTDNCRYVGMDRLLYWMFGYEDGGSSPQSLGGGYYSHLFELDKHERHITPYRTEEQTAGDYASTDRKNRLAIIAVKRGTNDYRYPFAMCSGFGFSSKAGSAMMWKAKALAYREDRGSYNSASWTIPTGMDLSANMILHHHITVSLGVPGALSTIAVTDFDCNVDIPLDKTQDTVSGLYPAEPVLAGPYAIQLGLTLTRHSSDTYAAWRDAGTELACKIVASSGSYGFEIYFPKLKITDTNISDDAVAKHPLTFASGPEPVAGNPFSSEVGSHDLIEKGNIFIITKNQNSTNEMRRE